MVAPSPRALRPVATPAPRKNGFVASLEGADLSDLVQMTCLARERKVVRVTSNGIAGYLYFSEGRIVDALARDLEGRAAALEILGWRDGSFEPVDLAWSGRETITEGWQGLLLEAMQQRDERQHDPMPAKEIAPVQRLVPPSKTPGAQQLPFGNQFTAAVRVSADGAIGASQGDAEALAGVAALAGRLCQIIGEHLAIDPFVALECSFDTGSCILYSESSGDVVAVEPAITADLSELRRQLGL